MNPPTELIDDLRLLEPPEPFQFNYWLLLAALAAFVLIGWIIRSRLAKSSAQSSEDALRQAHANALADLERLFALIDSEQSRPYAIESSAIIRRYIEVRFDLAAPKRSTEEFLAEAQHSPKLAPEYQTLLADFLQCCDLLKFARTLANRNELVQLHDAAIHFVKETDPAEPWKGDGVNDWIWQLDTFRFASPWWLLALLLIPLAMWLVGRVGNVSAVQFSSGALLHAAARKSRFSPGRYRPLLRHLALCFLILALARPQVDKGLTDREALGINIMFVLDFSSTMKTKDFLLEGKRVSRVDAMKRMVSEFIKARESDRIGAVYFDMGAHLISPLTLDHEWLLVQLATTEANRGTAPGSGMLIAAEALMPAKDQTKVIITVTDADQVNEGAEPLEVARVLAPLGIKNHVIQIVDFTQAQQTTASGRLLAEVARTTGGEFFKVSDYSALRSVYRQIDTLEKSAFKENKQRSWREMMAWFAIPGCAMLLLELVLAQTVWRRLP